MFVIRYSLFCLLFLPFTHTASAQVVYENTGHNGIYELLDELANEKLVGINSVVKPYSRIFIAEKLQEAIDQKEKLSPRQLEEVEFYLKDYRLELVFNTRDMKPLNIFPEKEQIATSLSPLAFTYRDSLFAFTLRPVWGMETFINGNQSAFHHRIGVEGFAYFSKNFGVYANFSHNYENTSLTDPDFFIRRPGGVTDNYADGSLSFNDVSWGVMYSWKWGTLGIVKDRPEWGNNYYGANILSGHAPAFIQIRLQLKPARWFEFNYLHGWLGSDVIDSSRSYWEGNNYHEVMRPKYIAANMFTFILIPQLNISLGSSTIYSDIDVQAAYLVPFIFFRSVDYELSAMSDNASANSQMFFDISSRNIKHLQLFFTLFVDELSVYRIGKSDVHNFLSYKGGFRLGNWPLQNLSLTAEYTYTLPMVYQHYITSTNFTSDSYSMGHYMRDNSHDLYLALQYKPLRGLRLELSYNFAQHGNNYVYGEYKPGDGAPILEDITWQKNIFGLKARYAFLSNATFFVGVFFSNIRGYDVDDLQAEYYLRRFTPEMFWEQTTTVNAGFRVGL